MSVHSDPDCIVKPLVCAGSTLFITVLWIRIRPDPKLLTGSGSWKKSFRIQAAPDPKWHWSKTEQKNFYSIRNRLKSRIRIQRKSFRIQNTGFRKYCYDLKVLKKIIISWYNPFKNTYPEPLKSHIQIFLAKNGICCFSCALLWFQIDIQGVARAECFNCTECPQFVSVPGEECLENILKGGK